MLSADRLSGAVVVLREEDRPWRPGGLVGRKGYSREVRLRLKPRRHRLGVTRARKKGSRSGSVKVVKMEELEGTETGDIRFLYTTLQSSAALKRARLARSSGAKPKRVHAKPNAALLNPPE